MLCQVIASSVVSALNSYLVKFAVIASACALELAAMTVHWQGNLMIPAFLMKRRRSQGIILPCLQPR